MSYDLSMVIDTGGEYPATVAGIGNYTSNVSGMWAKAIGTPLRDLHGKTGAELIPVLEKAVSHISHPDTRAEYVAMNPTNGWGDNNGAAQYLVDTLAACRQHPKAQLQVHC